MNEWATEFEQFNAKWHKSCRLKFSVGKLELLTNIPKKRVSSNDSKSRTPRSKDKQNKNLCLFCDKEETEEKILHKCETFELDQKIRRLCDNSAQYASVKIKLSEGDMIAIGARYHLVCLSAFYRNTEPKDDEHSIEAFDEVLKHIYDWLKNVNEKLLFLKDLHSLYVSALEEIDEYSPSINRTRLKEKILKIFPEIICLKHGKEVVFYKSVDSEDFVKTYLSLHGSNEEILDAAVKIIRTYLSDFCTDDSMGVQQVQHDAIPKVLLEFITKLLLGSIQYSQPALTIAQLIKFNFVRRYRPDKQSHQRHLSSKESPLTLYTGS